MNNLFLSRLCLNPLFAPALRFAADPYDIHLKLLATLPCVPKPKPATGDQPKTAGVLFRVDTSNTGPVVLIQTMTEPDWGAFKVAPRAFRCPPKTKAYDPKFTPGQRLAFRLLGQPAVRKSGRFGLRPNGKRMPGPRQACHNDEERLAWLRRKGTQGGFAIETVGLSRVDWRNTKPMQAKGGQVVETYEQARRRAFGYEHKRLDAVRFDGVLVVTDPVIFCATVAKGVGSGKAFGFGLLSIARADP